MAESLRLYRPGSGQRKLEFSKDDVIHHDREWFARVMVDPNMTKLFEEYVEREHCSENIQFYNELTALEDKLAAQSLATTAAEAAAYETARSVGSTHALARFLRSAAATSAVQEDGSPTSSSSSNKKGSALLMSLPPLPSSNTPQFLIPSFVNLYNKFIAQGAPLEINITDASRKKITAGLKEAVQTISTGQSLQPGVSLPSFPSNVFDPAGDQIVELLYRDTFKRFVAYRLRPPQPQESSQSVNEQTEEEDDLAHIDGNMALMFLAQAAMQAEQAREEQKAAATAIMVDKKKSSKTSFWRRGGKEKDKVGNGAAVSTPARIGSPLQNGNTSTDADDQASLDSKGSPLMARSMSTKSVESKAPSEFSNSADGSDDGATGITNDRKRTGGLFKLSPSATAATMPPVPPIPTHLTKRSDKVKSSSSDSGLTFSF